MLLQPGLKILRFTLLSLADPIAAQVAGPFDAIQRFEVGSCAWEKGAEQRLTLEGLRRISVMVHSESQCHYAALSHLLGQDTSPARLKNAGHVPAKGNDTAVVRTVRGS